MKEREVDTNEPKVLDHNHSVTQQIVECIETGRCCTLLGPRYSGKSVLLHHIQHTLVKDPAWSGVYISLEDLNTSTQSTFFANFAQSICHQLEQSNITIAIDVVDGPTFRDFFHAILDRVLCGCVLIVDHLEHAPADIPRTLLSALRAIYMERGGGQKFVALVAGALSLSNLTVGESSPFYGITRTVYVGDITEQESLAHITSFMTSRGIVVSDEIYDYLVRMVGGTIHLMNHICRECIEHLKKNESQHLRLRDVQKIIKHFMRYNAAQYGPLREAIRLIEDDPDLLLCIIQLLEEPIVPRYKLPLRLTPDVDPLYLTGLVQKVDEEHYQFRNEVYRECLNKHFQPNYISHLLAISGRWDAAVDYLYLKIKAGRLVNRNDILEATISPMYAAGNTQRAASFALRALSMAFEIHQAQIWLVSSDLGYLALIHESGDEVSLSYPTNEWTVPIDPNSFIARAWYENTVLREKIGNLQRCAMPLRISDDNPIGILLFDEHDWENDTKRHERDRELLGYLKRSARAMQEVRTTENLRNVATVIGKPLDIDEVLRLSLEQITHMLPCDSASIQLINANQSALEIVASRGFLDPQGIRTLTFPLEDRFPNVRVWKEKLPLRYSKVRIIFPHLGESQYQIPHVNSWLGVPLIVDNEAIGVITLDSHMTNLYRAEQEHIAMLIASQTALAIARAHQYERKVREKELIHMTAQMASSTSMDRRRTWRDILEKAMQLTGAEMGSFGYINEAEDAVTITITLGEPEDYPERPYAIGGRSVQGWVSANKQPALIRNVKTDAYWKDIYYDAISSTLSELAVPIFQSDTDRVIGIINLESPREGAFSLDDQQLLEELAVYASPAIDNTQKLLEQSRHRMRALNTAGRIIVRAGMNTHTIFQAILSRAVEVTGASFGTLQMVEGDCLKFVATWPTEMMPRLQQHFGDMSIQGPGITTRAARENKAQLVADTRHDTDLVDVTGETKSELAVVLRRDGVPIGVLNVEHTVPNGLTEDDRELLLSLAHLTTVALENAERYEELQRTKDYMLASEAVAWMGLFGANWQHSINQKVFSVLNYTDGLQRYLTRQYSSNELNPVIGQALNGIREAMESIQSVGFASLVPAERPDNHTEKTVIDRELPELVQRWCHERKDVLVHLDLSCEHIAVAIQVQWFDIVLEKLIHNALKAMPSQGSLTITTRHTHDTVCVTLQDTGCGIPEAIRPFFLKQTIPNRHHTSGTGVGALIARFVLLQHGGDVELIDTQEGYGTTIQMRLPVATDTNC